MVVVVCLFKVKCLILAYCNMESMLQLAEFKILVKSPSLFRTRAFACKPVVCTMYIVCTLVTMLKKVFMYIFIIF